MRLPGHNSYAYFASNHKNQDFSWYYQFGILPIHNDFKFLAMSQKIEILTNRQAYLFFCQYPTIVHSR